MTCTVVHSRARRIGNANTAEKESKHTTTIVGSMMAVMK
jgi:hypothetical protein